MIKRKLETFSLASCCVCGASVRGTILENNLACPTCWDLAAEEEDEEEDEEDEDEDEDEDDDEDEDEDEDE